MLASYNGNPPSSVRPMQMPNVQESWTEDEVYACMNSIVFSTIYS
jgi:hypothetical protein